MSKYPHIVELVMSQSSSEHDVVRALRRTKEFLEYYFFKQRADLHEGIEPVLGAFIEQAEGLEEGIDEFLRRLSTNIQSFTPESFYGILEDVKIELAAYPRLTLSLPTILEREDLGKITLWARANVHPQTIVRFKSHPGLSAGCSISWNNNKRDYSFSDKLEQAKQALLPLFDKP